MTVLAWVMIAALIAIAGILAIFGVVVGFKIAARRAAKKAKAEAEAERNAEIERLKKAEEERKQAEAKAKAEAEAKAKAEAEAKAKAEAEAEAKAKAEAEAKAKAEAEAKARAEADAKRDAEIERLKKAEEERKQAEAEAKAEAERKAKVKANAAEIAYIGEEIPRVKLELGNAQASLELKAKAVPGAEGDIKKAKDALFTAMACTSRAAHKHALSGAARVTADQRVTLLNGRGAEAEAKAKAERDTEADVEAACLDAFDKAFGVQLATAESIQDVEAALKSAKATLDEEEKAVNEAKAKLTGLLGRYEELTGSKYEDPVLYVMLTA